MTRSEREAVNEIVFALTRISNATVDGLDHARDCLVLERAIGVATKALEVWRAAQRAPTESGRDE